VSFDFRRLHETFRGVFLEKLSEQVASRNITPRNLKLVSKYFLSHSNCVHGKEGGLAELNLEEKAPKAPPIEREPIALFVFLIKHFRRNEFVGAAEAVGAVAVEHAILGEAEVGQFEIAVGANHRVLALYITMDDAQIV